ncbi:MAG: PqiC family protein [Alphaproteobacteria bacterium]|nr:PqiC family protein [Alphaproteobacteria bacterium]
MNRQIRDRPLARLLVLGILVAVAACAESQPSKFYVLSSLKASEAGAVPGGTQKKPLAVGVGPITMPEYLDRPQVVTRSSPTKLSLAEFDRWAEPLTPLFTRVMVENMSVLLASERVYGLPRRSGGRLDYQVEIDVFRFDSDASGEVFLTARWTLYGTSRQRPLRIRQTTITESAGSAANVESLAAAMSRAVEQLSREIAREIEAQRA